MALSSGVRIANPSGGCSEASLIGEKTEDLVSEV